MVLGTHARPSHRAPKEASLADAVMKTTAVGLALCTLSSVAFAQTPPAAPATTATPAAAPAAAPASRTTPAQAAMQRGLTAYTAHDLNGAMTAFREAATADPRSAVAPLFLGLIARGRDDAPTAMAHFREAQRIATAEGDDGTRGRALAAIAEQEERAGHWDEARAAWQVYVVFADGHATVTDAAIGRARIEAIGRRTAMNTQYEPVRQRIAERLARNASGVDQQPPPPQLPPSAIRGR